MCPTVVSFSCYRLSVHHADEFPAAHTAIVVHINVVEHLQGSEHFQ
jgi:hypothetical protein